ncbi:MAG TPA: glycosyltransferase [Sediminibacterium sp.]|nr:glycosyltransferase [Sediminibacterium sp.]
MQLSVIIVNYRVRLFLEQCLYSLRSALAGLDAEIWVVDNASLDGSIGYLQPRFPEVKFLPQTTNLGYGRANNLALKHCRGAYVLLLNPDTLVPATVINESLQYIRERPACGAVGVRMIDGNGRYLPESKRSFPGPWASFTKLTGLAALFPKSGALNRYAAGQLSEKISQPVEVLAGAYILARRSVLAEVGGFNEAYFLFGEDIDLSMRIRKAGYENHYLGNLTILHFKGESTGSIGRKRIHYFYQAMQIFVRDYYPGSTARILPIILLPSIRLRQAVSVLGSFLKPFRHLLADGSLLLASFWLIQTGWIAFVRGGKPFGISFAEYAVILYTCCVLAAAAFAGLYQRNGSGKRVFMAAGFSGICLLAAYSLLPENLRYSRGVVLLGGLAGIAAMVTWRKIALKRPGNQVAVICEAAAYPEIADLLVKNLFKPASCRHITPAAVFQPGLVFSEVVRSWGMGILVISPSNSCRLEQVFSLLPALHQKGIRVVWHHTGSGGFVGSEPCKPGAQDFAPYCPYQLQSPYQRFMKRLADNCRAGALLLCAPFLWLFGRWGRLQIKNAWRVFIGEYCFTGYLQANPDLPPLKPGIHTHSIRPGNQLAESLFMADRRYAADYEWWRGSAHLGEEADR